MANYHPHGDLALYDTLVRMAQDFSLRYPLVDGQGNFGIDRRRPPGRDALHRGAPDRDRATRCWPTSRRRPSTLSTTTTGACASRRCCPRGCPTCWSTARSGIAVGMATNIPPHNLTEICDAVIRLIDNPDMSVDELCEIVTGPDFPTGGTDLPLRGRAQPGDRREGAPGRHPAHVCHRPRPRDHPWPGRVRGGPRRPHGSGHHRAAVPGQQDQPDRKDGGPGRRQAHQRRQRHSRRKRQNRDAHRRRGQARRLAAHRHAAALQAHAAPDQLQRQHAGPRRRPTADPGPEADARALHHLSPRGGPAAHRLRPGARAGAGPHRRGPEDCARQPGCGDRHHSRLGRHRRSADGAHEAVRALRGAGQRDPRDAAPPACRAGAQEDRGRIPGTHPAHRRAGGPAGQPTQDPDRSSPTS